MIVPSSGVDVITLGWEQGLAIAYTPALCRAIYNPDRRISLDREIEISR